MFVAGGTGYMGQKLISRLLERGHQVRALVRSGSEKKLPAGCTPILGNALDGASYAPPNRAGRHVRAIGGRGAFQSRESGGVPTGRSSRRIRSRGSGEVGGDSPFCLPERGASRAHDARLHCGAVGVRGGHRIRGIECDAILRPWYVLGPRHWWPYLLLPMYKLAELVPSTREGAPRLGLVTLEQMTSALMVAVENPAQGRRIVTVPEIRAARA